MTFKSIFNAAGKHFLPNLSTIVAAGLLVLILSAHTYKLESIPAGLYFDESTIGLDASQISETGFDKYGGRFQIFFRSEADYDSPVLVYATALMFRLFGESVFNLRFVNALFFMGALLLAFWLVRGVFQKNRIIWIYLLISFGFLPQFFTLSRLSFEVISQLTFTTAACLGIWRVFHGDSPARDEFIKAIAGGLLIGISTYTYSTANILSALMVAALWIVYFSKTNIKKLLYISGASLVALIPYAVFNFSNPGALTSRFSKISYLFETIPLLEKIKIFFSNYFAYWTPGFLINHGDLNLRHSTENAGEIFIAVFILFVIGLFAMLQNGKESRFKMFLFLNLLASPVAAALTSEGTPHAVRSMLLGHYILIISCYGLEYLSEIKKPWLTTSSIILISVLLLYETVDYQFDYFVHYQARSVDAFGSYDMKGSLEFAIEEKAKRIMLFNNFGGGLENLQFYSHVIDNPENIPILAGPAPVPGPEICIIYRRLSGAEEELDRYPIPYKEFRSRSRPTPLEKRLGAEPFFGVIKARCYQGSK